MKQEDGSVLPAQTELKLSKFLAIVDGGMSKRLLENSVPTYLFNEAKRPGRGREQKATGFWGNVVLNLRNTALKILPARVGIIPSLWP